MVVQVAPGAATGARAHRQLAALLVVAAVAACNGADASTSPTAATPTAATATAAAPPTAQATQAASAPPFPISTFVRISEEPAPADTAVALQAALAGTAGGGGMAATVMTDRWTWSGATGTSDGTHTLLVNAQFGIASVTKSIIAAQVMQLVEAGELSLDTPATEYLPADFTFDTNGATIRQLLDMRSGIPDWYSDFIESIVALDRTRVWQTDEVLDVVANVRSAAGSTFEYADTNYTLLGLVIEHVRGRPLAEVLRDGVLHVEGTGRLVYQPAETPTDPIAMPRGEPSTALEQGGGYLPSMSDASSAGPAGAIASDTISLARWFRAFCAGEIVSQASVTEMSTFVGGPDGYGLGLFNPSDPWASAVGHVGSNFGYVSWAGCIIDDPMVVVVLANFAVDDIGGMAEPLIKVARSG